eukprot:scaffold2026_cov146-Skeletonema_marinoi.AAC.2
MIWAENKGKSMVMARGLLIYALGIHPCSRIQVIETLENIARNINCDEAQGSAVRDNNEVDESSTSLGIWNVEPNRYTISL